MREQKHGFTQSNITNINVILFTNVLLADMKETLLLLSIPAPSMTDIVVSLKSCFVLHNRN
jgi:hypothetical protein